MSRPRLEMAVSPCSTSTSSNGTPSSSATIWLHAVSWPCPCGVEPVTTSTLPVGSIRMEACSQPPAPKDSEPSTREGARPHISVKVEMPMPSCTGSFDSRRRFCSARSSS